MTLGQNDGDTAREELEKKMDELSHSTLKTAIEKIKAEMEELSLRIGRLPMDSKSALAVLTDALDRCRDEDVRTPEVFAVDFLEARFALPVSY